jgi:hypothetical protein
MGEPAVSYEKEQEALRRRVEGDPDIHIEAPKEPEVKPEVYRDVEPMLFRGFITLPAEINEVVFVFKSLNQHEFELLRLSGAFEKNITYKFWDAFLAYGVAMIDGQNVLPDRDRWLPQITKMFAEMDNKPKQRVIRYLSEINRRASNAVILTECYFTETYSRYRWAQLRGLDLSSPTVTGFPGSERLGLNWAQLAWRALNHFEDRNEEIERNWENAKFVGSCFAGKSLQKVYHQDTERRRKEKEERFTRKDKVLRQVLMGEKPQENVFQIQGAVVTSARTAEELASQLEKDLKGDKDWHDQVIEEHEKRVRENFQARQNQIKEIVKSHEEEFGDKKLIGGTDFRGLTPAEVEEAIRRRKQIEAQTAARAMVYPELSDPKTSEFLDKWGMTGSEVDFKVEETDRDPSTAVPIVPRKQGGTPFGRK